MTQPYSPYLNGPGSTNQGVNPSAAAPQSPAYNFTPSAPGTSTVGASLSVPGSGSGPWGSGTPTQYTQQPLPQTGLYGSNPNESQGKVGANVAAQVGNQKYSQVYDPNYQDYTALNSIAQQYGQQAQTTLNNPGVNAAIGQQTALAGGTAASNGALGALAQAANGQGPAAQAAAMQQQAGISQAMRAQLTAAASARGGAYAQSGAQQNAAQQAAQIQLQGNQQATAANLQQQQAAQQAYATAANQQYGLETSAAQSAEQSQAQQQAQALGYYTGQQQAYTNQGQFAGNLAQTQVANDLGLAGTQLQTQTQQNIASQQQQTQLAGAGASALGIGLTSLLAAASTGGAEAAARGARDAGVSPETAARIGALIGQHIGDTRGIRTPATEAGDTAAAASVAKAPPKGPMSEDEARAHMASARKGKAKDPIPASARYEPAAHAAYQAGSALARLAAQHGRAA